MGVAGESNGPSFIGQRKAVSDLVDHAKPYCPRGKFLQTNNFVNPVGITTKKYGCMGQPRKPQASPLAGCCWNGGCGVIVASLYASHTFNTLSCSLVHCQRRQPR